MVASARFLCGLDGDKWWALVITDTELSSFIKFWEFHD